MVPKGWEIKHLSELASKISDGIHKTPLYADTSEIYFINGNNLKSGSIVIQDSTKCVDENDAINHRKDLGVRTLLMSINGTIGNLAYYRGENVVLGKSASYINIKDSVNLDFIYYVLSSSKTQAFYESELTGTTIRNLSIKSIKSTEILTPPLPEQKKIAQILSTWDKAISVTEKLLTNSQQQKKALMQQLLTGKKRLGLPAGSYEFKITRYGSIPKDWDYPAIKEICTQVSEKNSAAVDHPVLSCSKYDGFVDSLKYFNKKVYSDDLSGYRLIHRGCFGFPSNHIEEGSIGLQNLYDTGIVSPIYVVFRASPTKVDNSYLYAVLKTDHYKQIFGAATNASVDRRGSLRWKEFNQIHVPLPPLKEQQKISAVLSAADAEITTLEKKLACLKDEKKALMQQLLTGKRRVKVDEAVAE
ncbi:TPA: restriction endonuclease subunit S [Escherichia coli]|uniref:restriction endonuclease subunit S n=1 Tax=Escherichia coli TaxID=562 RepID=UPI001DF38A36|nr:restriction endonuclease subunit S [Escherichia coli]EHJ8804400.1 restriction endonuclease subunit S [Escherichia coli]EJC1996475.1 restriction endonuclease subunit S [Escherichia coli]ELS1178735.1 restriction endonuclease subunit S [Escherichia coli]HDV3302093.1 restriction endonuclease subunit S [Escherichia coli]